jgi:hypothetical protein
MENVDVWERVPNLVDERVKAAIFSTMVSTSVFSGSTLGAGGARNTWLLNPEPEI